MDKEDRTILEREEILTRYALRHACQELENLTGTPWDDWQQELINRARNWVQAELDQRFIDELGEEVEEGAIAQ